MRKNTSLLVFCTAAVGVCLLASSPATALVLHPGYDPDDSGYTPLTDKPFDAVVGAWDPNNTSYGKASAVAIAPNYVLTTQHQGYKSGSTTVDLYIDGTLTTFQVAAAAKHDTADIMVGKLKKLDGTPANLDNYVPLFTGTNETSHTATVGGWGKRRGATLTDGGTDYGYAWTGAELDALTWGRNELESTGTHSINAGWKEFDSQVVEAFFNEPGVEYEAGIARADSGGGAFIYHDGTWKVAGLSAYTEHGNDEESWYDDPFSPGPFGGPDKLWFIRVSSYQTWINNNISDVVVPLGDANWDGEVDESDFSILVNNWDPEGVNKTWEMGDFTTDGAVGNDDFAIVLANWTGSVQSLEDAVASMSVVPEPATLGIMAIGTLALLLRRRSG